MNRREFFQILGIPMLALPFVKMLGLSKAKNFVFRVPTYGIYANTRMFTAPEDGIYQFGGEPSIKMKKGDTITTRWIEEKRLP